MEDLPNGFLNFPKRSQGFESAADAIRSSRNAANSRTRRSGLRKPQPKSSSDGWCVTSETKPEAALRACGQSVWGADGSYLAKDILQFVEMPDVAAGENAPVFNYDKLGRIEETDRRWSWIEISLPAIQSNVMSIKGSLPPEVRIMAVVKADGYGHGAVQVARTALNSGADYIGVATVDEAIQLRDAGIKAPILILSEPPASIIPLLLAYKVMPSVTTAEFAIKYAEAADSIGAFAKYHLKVNTGMNRIGVRWDEVIDFLRTISFHRALRLEGTFTHFATADIKDTMDFNLQRSRFEETIGKMRSSGIDPGIVHAANSAATLRYPQVSYDMVRVGLAMYGYYPSEETFGKVNLLPAMAVKARITQVLQVPVGEGVSYGLLHRSGGYSKTCTVPIGYADGLKRGLSGRISFIMGGRLYPQIGSICMDQCMFEVDQRLRRGAGKADPKIGDVVTIVGAEGNAYVTIDEMAKILGTIPYEIMIAFGNSRMPKIYI